MRAVAIAAVLFCHGLEQKAHPLLAPYLNRTLDGRTDYVAGVLFWGYALELWLGPRPWKQIWAYLSYTLVERPLVRLGIVWRVLNGLALVMICLQAQRKPPYS